MTGVTAQLAEWVHGMRRSTLSPEVEHQAKRIVLDYLASAIAGARTDVSRAVRSVVAEMYPGDHASVIGGGRASAAGAALANGTAAHALDIDDGYTPGSVHPSAPTLPAVLAAAGHVDPAIVLRAVAVAVEVTCRIARAGHPATRHAGFHNTPLAGVFGAAAGVCVVLGLDEVSPALGLAGSHAGGLFEFLGSGAEVKRLHAGKAARDGLLSAYLAARGVTGPASVLEGDNGYFHAFAGDRWRPADLLDGLGTTWALRDTYVKTHPCCRHLHAAIDALLALRAEHGLTPESVRGIRVETYAIAAAHSHVTFDSHLDAQMSLPYTAAVSIMDGRMGLAQFDHAHRTSPVVADLAKRVEVVASDDLDVRYPAERPARVTVHRTDGPDVCAEVGQPRGEPSTPLTDDELVAKFHLLADPVLGPATAARVVRSVWAFDDVQFLGELSDQ